MRTLKEWMNNNRPLVVMEGGMGGHMAHPIDYDDLTFADLIDMIDKLFNGDVTQIISLKEKLDGTNIQATMNDNGQTVFIRNKGDLNSALGGMTIEDMASKWSSKPSVADNYIRAGKIIEEIFSKVGKRYFNPDKDTRIVINCECISSGQTNVMLYANDRVAFHGTVTYKMVDGKWRPLEVTEGEPDIIRKAANGIEAALPRPQLVINNATEAKRLSQEAISALSGLMKQYGMTRQSTIADYKFERYYSLAPSWAKNDDCYNRIINKDKSKNLRILKKEYPEIGDYEKSSAGKQLYRDIMEPLDTIFSNIGNALISLLDGFTNANDKDKVVTALKKEVNDVREYVDREGTDEMRDVVARSLQRLSKLSNVINATEGVVFTYKGKLMKLTGSFSALNQLLGVKFMS